MKLKDSPYWPPLVLLTTVAGILVTGALLPNVDRARYESSIALRSLIQPLESYALDNEDGFFPDYRQWKKIRKDIYKGNDTVYIPGRRIFRFCGPSTAIVAWRKEGKWIFYADGHPSFAGERFYRFDFDHGELPVFFFKPDTYPDRKELAKKLDGKSPDLLGSCGQTRLLLQLIYRDDKGALNTIRAGQEINQADPNGITPLMRAVSNENLLLTGELLDHGADRTAKNLWGDTALDIAQKTGNRKIIRRLRQQ